MLNGKGEFGMAANPLSIIILLLLQCCLLLFILKGGQGSWMESGAHHTLVLGPGDHIEVKSTVSSLSPYT